MRRTVFKELLYDDAIIMLYKVRTAIGELCGYYDTKDGFFYSVLLDGHDPSIYHIFRRFVLYLYACMVCRDGADLLKRAEDDAVFYYASEADSEERMKIHIAPYGKGGKLLNMYRPEKNAAVSSPDAKRAGSDKYESEQKAIQGFIRRVGAGKTPSEEAVARAKALGYDLAPDETYVQPFMRRVLKLKKAEPQK